MPQGEHVSHGKSGDLVQTVVGNIGHGDSQLRRSLQIGLVITDADACNDAALGQGTHQSPVKGLDGDHAEHCISVTALSDDLLFFHPHPVDKGRTQRIQQFISKIHFRQTKHIHDFETHSLTSFRDLTQDAFPQACTIGANTLTS